MSERRDQEKTLAKPLVLKDWKMLSIFLGWIALLMVTTVVMVVEVIVKHRKCVGKRDNQIIILKFSGGI